MVGHCGKTHKQCGHTTNGERKQQRKSSLNEHEQRGNEHEHRIRKSSLNTTMANLQTQEKTDNT